MRTVHPQRSISLQPASQRLPAAASAMMVVAGWLAGGDGQQNRGSGDSRPQLGQPKPLRPPDPARYATGVIQRWFRRAHRPNIGLSRRVRGCYLRITPSLGTDTAFAIPARTVRVWSNASACVLESEEAPGRRPTRLACCETSRPRWQRTARPTQSARCHWVVCWVARGGARQLARTRVDYVLTPCFGRFRGKFSRFCCESVHSRNSAPSSVGYETDSASATTAHLTRAAK